MQTPDLINGCFEAVGGLLSFLNCKQLYIDKEVKGVKWQLTIFWMSWGIWNLYYYPHLEQILSFYGGLLIVTANAIWVLQVIYYLKLRPRLLAARA